MGYPTRVQLIRRQESEQGYINFPAPIARAMEFDKGEVVEWVIQDRHTLTLHRSQKRRAAETAPKKNARPAAGGPGPLGAVPGRLRPAPDRSTRPEAGPEPTGLLGATHPDRAAVCRRTAVPRLVGRLPTLLPMRLEGPGGVRSDRPGHGGDVAGRVPGRRRDG